MKTSLKEIGPVGEKKHTSLPHLSYSFCNPESTGRFADN